MSDKDLPTIEDPSPTSWGLQGWGGRFKTKEEAQAYGAKVSLDVYPHPSANPVLLAYSDQVKHQLLWQEGGVDYGSKDGLIPPPHTPLILTSVHLDSIEGVTPVTKVKSWGKREALSGPKPARYSTKAEAELWCGTSEEVVPCAEEPSYAGAYAGGPIDPWFEAQRSLVAAGLCTTLHRGLTTTYIVGGASRTPTKSGEPIVYSEGFMVFIEDGQVKIATTSSRFRALDDTSYDSLPKAIATLVEEVVRTKDELSPSEKLRKVLEGITSTPHVVSPPSTDAEISSSDNKVIREAYLASKDSLAGLAKVVESWDLKTPIVAMDSEGEPQPEPTTSNIDDPALDDLRKACEVAGLVAVEKGTLEDEKARSASWRESYETLGAKADEDQARAEKAEAENANLKTTIVAMSAESYKLREEEYRISKELKATIAKLEKELSDLKSAPVQAPEKSVSPFGAWYCYKHPEYLFRTILEVEISERAPIDTTSKVSVSGSQKEPNSKLVLSVIKDIGKPAEAYELDCSVEEALTRLGAQGKTHVVGITPINTALLPLPKAVSDTTLPVSEGASTNLEVRISKLVEPFTESDKQKLSQVIRGYFQDSDAAFNKATSRRFDLPPQSNKWANPQPAYVKDPAADDKDSEVGALGLGALFGVVLGTSLLTFKPSLKTELPQRRVVEATSPLTDEVDEVENHQAKTRTS